MCKSRITNRKLRGIKNLSTLHGLCFEFYAAPKCQTFIYQCNIWRRYSLACNRSIAGGFLYYLSVCFYLFFSIPLSHEANITMIELSMFILSYHFTILLVPDCPSCFKSLFGDITSVTLLSTLAG